MQAPKLLRNVFPDPKGSFADGAGWCARLLLAFVHLLFGITALLRPNVPLLFPSYDAFDDVVDFHYWGYAGLLAALLLMLIPSRSPWAVISVGWSMTLFYMIGATFSHSAGLIPGTAVYTGLGVVSALLLMRSAVPLLEQTHPYRWATKLGARWLARKRGQHGG